MDSVQPAVSPTISDTRTKDELGDWSREEECVRIQRTGHGDDVGSLVSSANHSSNDLSKGSLWSATVLLCRPLIVRTYDVGSCRSAASEDPVGGEGGLGSNSGEVQGIGVSTNNPCHMSSMSSAVLRVVVRNLIKGKGESAVTISQSDRQSWTDRVISPIVVVSNEVVSLDDLATRAAR
jgi:hypothetical protein